MADKSMAEISTDELAELIELEVGKDTDTSEPGCFGSMLFDPNHLACKECADMKACSEAAESSDDCSLDALSEACKSIEEITGEPVIDEEVGSGITDQELEDAIAEMMEKEAGDGKADVSVDTLDAIIKSEEKATESAKIESSDKSDTTVPGAEENPSEDSGATGKVDTEKITKPKAKKKKAAPKKPTLEPVDGPITGEMVGPHMILRKHPGIDMNAVAGKVIEAKPQTTNENNQVVKEAMLEFGGTQEAVDNSAYGTARRCLQTIQKLRGISLDGKSINWLKE